MCFKCFRMWFLNAVDWKGGKSWDCNGRSWPSLIHFWLYSQVGKTLKRDFPCFSWSLIRPLSRKISSFLQRLKANQKIVKVLIVGQQTRTGKSETHSSSTGKYYTGRREENQLDATECFIALIICSTCFGYLYAHHQELEIILVLLPHMVCSALVAGIRLLGAEPNTSNQGTTHHMRQ